MEKEVKGAWADPEAEDRGSGPPPLKNHKNIGYLSNTGLDPLENHKVTKLAFNVGPLSACQSNAISMEFRWRADDQNSILSLKKTKKLSVGPPLTKLSGSAHGESYLIG